VNEKLQKLVDEMEERGVLFPEAMREFERRFITRVLADADGNLCKAATMLGMHRNTLSRKISEYRIRRSA
jgi:DNA-binding NtrC family response regulator